MQGLLSGEPLRGIDHEQVPHQVLCLLRDRVPLLPLHLVHARLNQRDLMRVGAVEGHVADEEDEDHHPQAPHVALRRVALVEDLRRHVRQRAAARREFRLRLPDLGKAEVYQLQLVVVLLLVHKILELHVAVHDAVAVDVVQGQEDLPDSVGSVLLRKVTQVHHPVEKLPPLHALHDQAELVLALVNVHEPRDPGVVHAQEHLSFALHVLPHGLRNVLELETLDRAPLARGALPGKVDLATGAPAEHVWLQVVVVLQHLGRQVVPPRVDKPGAVMAGRVAGLRIRSSLEGLVPHPLPSRLSGESSPPVQAGQLRSA
mmetsp:Transcript_34596/g.103387  ORF Transcript_34596/g.103387 Transcript_34596/m.103387 type:complete len:316 (-) Transcript_34596:17-964(-)